MHGEFFRSGGSVLTRLSAPDAVLPRLALLDLNMPGESGLDVIRAVRAQPHLAGLRIVVFWSSENQAEQGTPVQRGRRRQLHLQAAQLRALPERVSQTLDYWRSRPVSANVARTVVPPPGDSSAHT